MPRANGVKWRPRAGARAACTLVVIFASLLPPAATALADGGAPIEVLGRLPEAKDSSPAMSYVIDVDSRRSRMLYLWRKGRAYYLREYDLSSDIPRLLRERLLGDYADFGLNSASPYTIAVDRRRRRAYLLGESRAGFVIHAIDLKSFQLEGSWASDATLPGFLGDGLMYSPEDDRIYILGAFSNGYVRRVGNVARAPAMATAAVALKPPDGDAGPSLAWSKVIPECQRPLATESIGALIARSADHPLLYFACARPDPYPGESGVVRLTIDPDADQSVAEGFTTEFFAISGSYTGGTGQMLGASAFDRHSERFFMQSISNTTPGAWVFDGRLSAWVGFIAAPDSNNNFLGLDQASGRYYMASLDRGGGTNRGYLIVVDGRATPIPQGTRYDGMGTANFIYPDNLGRLFVQMELGKLGLGKKDDWGFVVLRDLTPDPKRPRPLDFDSLTSLLPEGKDTVTSYSGGVDGYGARALLVGGYRGVLSAAGHPSLTTVGQLRGGDRGITTARIPSLDLRDVGASATAQALAIDDNTAAELSDHGQKGPWRPVACLDGSGTKVAQEDAQTAGYSKVECDLKSATATAQSNFGRLDVAGISVASSSAGAVSRRDGKLGVVSEITSIAEGIGVPSENGTLSIDRVVATARTVAHGHPKTAAARWWRTISGVEVLDANGDVVQSLGGCDSRGDESSCTQLRQEINALLPSRIRVELPTPEVVTTPKGAFAGVRQTDGDFYHNRTVNSQGSVFSGEGASRAVPALQITVLNDTQEKSRAVVQLAAVQANSIYTISRTDPDAPLDGGSPVLPGGGSEAPSRSGSTSGSMGPPESTGGDESVAGAPAPMEPVAVPGIPGVLAFITRSPQEAALVALVWLLFMAAGWTVVRRYQLIDVLGTGDR